MEGCTYFVPLDYVEESTNTVINKLTIKILDCNNTIDTNNLCGLWNFNRCPNDDDYCNPFIKGDKLYFQYMSPASEKIQSAIPQLYDLSTGQIILPPEGLFTVQSNTTTDAIQYYNLIIDTDKLSDSVTCFYLKISFYKCDLKRNKDYSDCVRDRIAEGMTAYLAALTCSNAFCEDKEEIYAEPYCRVRCEEPTLLLTGFYPKYDCDGNYYGMLRNVVNIFVPQIRIYGEIQYQNFTFEEVLVNNIRTSVKRKTNYYLQSKKLPLYVVKQVAKIFGSQKVIIDGIEYKGAVTLNKNFDEGQMWILKESIFTLCDENNFTCE